MSLQIEPNVSPLNRHELDRLAAFVDSTPQITHKEWLEKCRVAMPPEDDVLDEIAERDIEQAGANSPFWTDYED